MSDTESDFTDEGRDDFQDEEEELLSEGELEADRE